MDLTYDYASGAPVDSYSKYLALCEGPRTTVGKSVLDERDEKPAIPLIYPAKERQEWYISVNITWGGIESSYRPDLVSYQMINDYI